MPVQSEFFHSWINATMESLFFPQASCPGGQDGLCSLNELLFLHLLYAVLVLAVASLYFLGDTSNTDLETKRSICFMVLSLSLVMYKRVLLKLGTHLQNPRNPNGARIILQIDRKRDISTHFEHSL